MQPSSCPIPPAEVALEAKSALALPLLGLLSKPAGAPASPLPLPRLVRMPFPRSVPGSPSIAPSPAAPRHERMAGWSATLRMARLIDARRLVLLVRAADA